MNLHKQLTSILFLGFILFAPFAGLAQITAIADNRVQTNYTSAPQQDIFIFCGSKDSRNAYLTATEPNGEISTFEWRKYNSQQGTYDFFRSDSPGDSKSTMTELEDGGYSVRITSASGDKYYYAWVFNDYIEATAEITDSDCNSFYLAGNLVPHPLYYTDPSNHQILEVVKTISVEWRVGSSVESRVISFRNVDPPTKDTEYVLYIADGLGCSSEFPVTYTSIVTKASFDFEYEDQGKYNDANKPEAPLTVTFTNTSENGDPGKYEWFIFKDLQKIKDEIKAKTFTDSIMEVVYNDSPVYTFEATGEYKVKLVSKHVSENITCTDTFYIAKSIVIDSAFIEAPNVFTPNGDGVNDKYAINFFSMKSLKISIFNRWGKVVHVWENNNIPGFSKTVSESVWDGKVGGKYATPGVYFYVAEGVGRDGKRKKANGFFHLFRDK
jgi:gliding motility-associated-like protein